jgi:hypothetical protein
LKTRIIVWSVVVIAVIAGLVFILSSGSRRVTTRVVTLETVKADAVQAMRQVERLQKRLADAQPQTAGGAPGSDAAQMLTDAKSRLERLQQAGDLKAAQAELRDVKQLMRKARRSVEVASKGRTPTPGL